MQLQTVLHTCTATETAGIFDGAAVGLGVFFLIGLFGGAHCLGMCGPLVTTYSDRLRKQERAKRSDTLSLFAVRQHALFNLGRTASYATIGALFGLAGAALTVSVEQTTTILREVNIVVGLIIGTAIIAAGLHYLFRGQVLALPGESLLRPITQAVQTRLMTRVDASVGNTRIVGLGALHGLLPCPLLYPAFLYAFVQASPLGGAVVLAVLGIGTIPALFIYGTLFQSLSVEVRMKLHRVLGVVFILLGYIPLQHALMLMGIHLPHPPIPFYQPL
ncbi:sulfite exporter TauE/SafE family protein [Natronocalculus amylovorans]|uniref:Sulfite exporter TauE/SafE family protein n=1 Tax=Natronocalculus amylovorans TaxID=2917812 RepID=A0AAE3FZI4_9EURY|nr:sulfite exporter TauE/SafE family protein [Natronocalculus amylovorans]MCL9818070.1 sulfite exporter TauE/SafE family protein [Natronocalculus amylovorans]